MPKLMVVDDEYIVTMQLEESLKAMGYNVVGTAASGEDAREMAEKFRPDLILMDILMPGKLDGIAAAEIIKVEMGIPVLFLTGYADEEFVNRAKRLEPLGYLLKPFNEGQIRAAVEIALFKKDMEEVLRKAQDELEKRVEERTAELTVTNEKLKQEIEVHNLSAKELRKRKKELEISASNLKEANIALKVLLKRIDEDKTELEEKMLFNVKVLVVPYLEKLKNSELNSRQEACLNLIESNLNDIILPFSRKLSSFYSGLTLAEIQVANLVKEGKTTKQIAEMLSSSSRAIEFHRNNLRNKLGLKNKKVNLRSCLLSLK